MDPRDPSHPLNSYTTDELLKVVGTRYESLVFIATQPKTKSAQDMTFLSVGHYHSCLGLVEIAKMMLTAGGPEDE
ncbi:hypothetical protein UFOVP403_8 [uncultured Caudovirales phage]|jgi:hypothetical protein|uniref:Uncharacterized protein n=1 Tax=uncultured Caudovirales phage TaxID=2100421 RepID=A0A6J5M084_9CAUD|nr:hypothetical protein UFOVP403_8 [uncultured Caudovirales phage]